MKKIAVTFGLLMASLLILSYCTVAQTLPPSKSQTVSNMVFGMYGGLALLMDVHLPVQPNGYAIVFVPGSGFLRAIGYDAPPLKEESDQLKVYANPLVEAGYTLFVINHRAVPLFRYPAPIEDGERAVRFVRHNAKKFGLSSEKIGGIGFSSGAMLVSLLGTLDGKGDLESLDSVQRESSKLQAVVAFGILSDLLSIKGDLASLLTGSYMGMVAWPTERSTIEYKAYVAASPLYQVSKEDAPHLLVHGDKDQVVPYEQAELMEKALRGVGVPVMLIRVPNAGHFFSQKPEYPDFTTEMVRWFDQYLQGKARNR